jgi:signal transduction histidine kinase/DNA-binding response OmpR family regulator
MFLSTHPLHDHLMELRAQAVRWVAGGAIVLACVIVYVWAFRSDLTGVENIAVATILAGSAAAAWWLVDRTYVGATITLLAGLLASIVASATLWSTSELLYALPLVLFVAPLLISYRHTLLIGVAEATFVIALVVSHLIALPGADLTIVLALILISAGLSWVAYQPIQTMIGWTWASYLEERRKTEEVRERQAQLAQLSKSLEEACERLEQANLALAEARRAAEEARRIKDEFATAISHELRTPINLIIGFSEMIVHDATEDIPATLRRDLETIYRNACHLSTLVDDVLDLGRLDAQRLALVKSWNSLPEIVHQAIQAVKGMYDKAGVRVTTDLPTDLPVLYLDPTRIRQVLINLLANAVRYVEEGFVQVSARCDGREVVVAVADTGVGIPPEDLPHVFERFHQTGPLRRRGGFGLGLTVSKQLVEMHAGSMWVTSEINRGTTFYFSLPVAANVVATASNPRLSLLEAPRPGAAGRRNLLVVSQDPEAIQVFERYLDGYSVLVATSPEEVATLCRKSVISALLLTNSSPAGIDPLVHAHLRRIPIIRCSLRTVTRDETALGAAAFLAKPVTAEQLHQALRRLQVKLRRALVVDDDPEMAELLSRMLRSIAPRCQTQLATDGELGLAFSREWTGRNRPDVVLLDLLMPGLDGHAFLSRWTRRSDLANIPIIVVSAATEEGSDAIIGESVEVRRDGGLTVAELMGVVQESLDRLISGAPSPSLAPREPRAVQISRVEPGR